MPVCSTAVLQWVCMVIIVITAHSLYNILPLVGVSGILTALLEALQKLPWQSYVHSRMLLITDSVFYLSEFYMSQNSGIFFSRDVDEMNINHMGIPTCFADTAYPTKFCWITVLTKHWATSSALNGCSDKEPLKAEGLLWKWTVHPIRRYLSFYYT